MYNVKGEKISQPDTPKKLEHLEHATTTTIYIYIYIYINQ